ncbi:glycosyltransferase family 1 protein [Granulicella sp. dw_53]|uniref:glycosyltransferase family 4 protein n=1 Tax=Granulicella sp. dw_53 TaxID=2719792 RepID=UPI001BD49976|nr:glycosyltransferase family 1 protein [Granulicella sp. dw_53]
MLRFAVLMEKELVSRGHTVRLLPPESYLGRIQSLGSGAAKWLGYVDKFLIFPRKLKAIKKNFDVVHILDHSNAMYTKHILDVPHIVTCHDVLAIKSALGEVPQNVVSATGRKFQALILAGLKIAQLFVCDSECTRLDLLRVTQRDPSSASTVYLSLNYPYLPMERGEALARLDKLGFDGRAPFFIHVGQSSWYKNKLGVLQIFRHLTQLLAPDKSRLLLVGKALPAPIEEFITENDLQSSIVKLSNLSNEDLRAAYSLAEGLIFPSLQEGFGWPVLEAQACGCPVFTTDKPPMNEVGGAGAVYFDPSDTARAAEIIATALQDKDSIRQRGLANVLEFSVDQMIQGYEKAYQRAVDTKRH